MERVASTALKYAYMFVITAAALVAFGAGVFTLTYAILSWLHPL